MQISPNFNWFSSIAIFICACFIFVSAAPAAESIERRNAIKVVFPSLIIPAHQDNPDVPFGTQYTGDVKYVSASSGDEIVLYIRFDIPINGATDCYIKFRLPPKTPSGYNWIVTGSGKLSVYGLDGSIDEETLTWNDRPGRYPSAPLFKITQPKAGGDATVIGQPIDCPGGEIVDFEIAVTRSAASSFHWFELDHPKSGITLEMY